MSTAQRKGWKQSKLSSWQQLKSETKELEPKKPIPAKEPKIEVPVVDEVEEVIVSEPETSELPKIVRKGKKKTEE